MSNCRYLPALEKANVVQKPGLTADGYQFPNRKEVVLQKENSCSAKSVLSDG